MSRVHAKRLVQTATRFISAFTILALLEACDVNGCRGRNLSEPIPEGFPVVERVDRAGQVHLTSAGIAELGPDFANVVDPFGDLRWNGRDALMSFDFCPANNCEFRYRIASAAITTRPHGLHIVLTIARQTLVAGLPAPWVLAIGGGTCSQQVNDTVTLVVDADLLANTSAVRNGYTTVQISPLGSLGTLTLAPTCTSPPVQALWLFAQSTAQSAMDAWYQEQVLNVLERIRTAVNCQSSAYGCPTGSFAIAGDPYCHETADVTSACVRVLVGEDLRGDLGAALLDLPHSGAFGEYLLASVGDAQAVGGGLSFALAGGLLSTDETFEATGGLGPRPNPCVPVATRPAAPIIPALSVLQDDFIEGGTDTYDIGFGFSEAWLTYVGFELYESGALCVATRTAEDATVSRSLIPSMASAIDAVAFPDDAPSLRISLRPQGPPAFQAGEDLVGDPVMFATFGTIFVDFEVFVQERYIRLFTYIVHPRIQLNVVPGGSRLEFEVGAVALQQASTVGNLYVVAADESVLVGELDSHVREIFASLLRTIPGLELPIIPGMNTTIIPDGIRAVQQGGQGFLVTYCDMEPTP